MNPVKTPQQTFQVLMMPDYRKDNPYQALLEEALTQQQVSVHFPWGYRRIFPISRAIKDLKSTPDVLHLHWLNPYIKGSWWAIKLIYSLKFLIDIAITRYLGVKVIWTVHNRVGHDTKFPQLELWVRRALVQLVDGIIFHNISSLKELTQEYGFSEDKGVVIPIGNYGSIYPPCVSSNEAREKLGLPSQGRIYLNQGILRPYKGIEELLAVWSEHQKSYPNDYLVIAGKPLDEAYGEHLALIAEKTQRVMLWREFVSNINICLLYSAATVVVLPFTQILTSSSLMVAMSYGKPIIAPRLGGIPETLNTADWLLYDSTETHGLINALHKSTEADLEALSRLVIKACDELDWDRIATKTLLFYTRNSSFGENAASS